ncbi:MAG TPA: TetR/AcrR family transcriptional regulator [Phycisphaerae bacterium]|nr:TetR/AcrR family transcriptional regulator [Phycisphaerae bacterium]
MATPRTTRDRLIETAGDLFYTTGFQAVGLDRILSAVGITKTAFYKHFESKDDLILAVLDRRDRADIAEAIAHMRRHGGSDPRAQILAFFDLLADWFARPDFRGCFFMNAATEFPSAHDPIHLAAAAHGQHIAGELLLRVQAAGMPDPEGVTKQLMLLFSGAIAARHAGGVFDAAVTARLTAQALLSAQRSAPIHEARAARLPLTPTGAKTRRRMGLRRARAQRR